MRIFQVFLHLETGNVLRPVEPFPPEPEHDVRLNLRQLSDKEKDAHLVVPQEVFDLAL